MYNGAESIEHVNAYRQELSRQIDRAAREVEVERLLASANPERSGDADTLRLSGIVSAIASRLRPNRRLEQLPGN